MTLRDMVQKYGATSKLVKAICSLRGWRYNSQGAPPEWYVAWKEGLGDEIELELAERSNNSEEIRVP